MTTRRFFANNSPQQLISGSITSGATSVTCPTFTGWPTQFPFYATFELGNTAEEIVLVTNIVGNVATITRAQEGSTALAHLAGATFDHTVVAKDLDEANAHTSSNAGVHGVSGNVVGHNDIQTLSNKTLASPVTTGTLAGANATLSGTLGVTGLSTLATLSVTGAADIGSVKQGGNVLLPTGSVSMYVGTAAPAGWLLCDGTAVSRTTYASLYALVGTAYGVGDGTTTFNLPNLKGRAPVGVDAGQSEFNSLGAAGGEKAHTLTAAEMPVHSHDQGTLKAQRSTAGGASDITGRASSVNNQATVLTDVAISGNTGNTGSGTAHNNLQPYLALNFIIKS